MPEVSTGLLLDELISPSTLQEIQDRFSALGQVSMRLVDRKGRPMTEPSCSSPLCKALKEICDGRAACGPHDGRLVPLGEAGSTAAVPWICHTGLELYQVPIFVANQTVGFVIAGDRPKRAYTGTELERIAQEVNAPLTRLKAAVEAIPEGVEGRGENLQEFLSLLADTLAGIARERLELRDRSTELATLYEITEMFSGTDRLQAILDVIARRVGQVLKVKGCSIRLLDPDTGELVVRAVHNLSQRYLRKGPVRLGENPIDTAAFSGETVYIEDAATDPRIRYPEEARQEGIVSGLCVPMTYRGRTVGVLRIYADRKMRFSSYEEDLARAIGSQAAAAIVNAQLLSERRASEQYQQQMRTAGEIQRRMIPAHSPPHTRITFATAYDPTLDVGGDFYDFLELPKGNLGICIADVVGKGIPASLMMASVRSALRAHAETIYHIDQIVARVNRHLCRDNLISEFATLFYGVFSADGNRLTYCNAGHDPPLLLREGQLKALNIGGTVIGLRSDAVFARDLVDLQTGDTIVFYTDGIVDAMNYDKQRFGRPRLEEAIKKYGTGEAAAIAHQLLWDVRRFVGLARQTDDISLVVAKVH